MCASGTVESGVISFINHFLYLIKLGKGRLKICDMVSGDL
ncbi:hypothetical protein HMPREF1051_1775 [Neisseria sicca VK64]|uniref:Uncharacterized protein n=1 Tax=Neisseria sicca VK64 TaxID=1095748 RepID=I2NIL8_NEISI|nr:hypothetical protein HMPREF1051_1775 [Neisseria sicca VK64]